MRARIATILLLGITACAASRPSFIKGDAAEWTIPLVGPLEDGELVIPVTIEGKGPFLLVVDPGAPSAIDREIGDRLGIEIIDLRAHGVTQEDRMTGFRVYRAEGFGPPGMQYYRGTFMGLPRGSFRLGATPVDGVFGHFTSTLILDIDRDAGVLRVAYTGHEQPPMGGTRLGGKMDHGNFLVNAVIDGDKPVGVELLVELRQPMSRLWPAVAQKAGVAFGPSTRQVGDEFGVWVSVDGPGEAVPVAFHPDLPPIPIAFAAFVDARRSEDVSFSGTLGQDVLSRYRVMFDQDHKALWLAPRDEDLGQRAAERIARWPELAGCAKTGCATAEMVDPPGRGPAPGAEAPGAPAAHAVPILPPPRFVVTRAPDAPGSAMEIVLQALDSAGKPMGLPLLRASLGSGQQQVSAAYLAAGGAYKQAASFRVVDASPFPPDCVGDSCIVPIGR